MVTSVVDPENMLKCFSFNEIKLEILYNTMLRYSVLNMINTIMELCNYIPLETPQFVSSLRVLLKHSNDLVFQCRVHFRQVPSAVGWPKHDNGTMKLPLCHYVQWEIHPEMVDFDRLDCWILGCRRLLCRL